MTTRSNGPRVSASRSRRMPGTGRGPSGRSAGGGGQLLGQNLHVLAVENEAGAEKQLEQAGDREADIVQRVLPEHVELERHHADVAKAGEVQDLLQAVVGEGVEVVD